MKKNKYHFVYYFIVVSLVLVSAVIGSFADYILENQKSIPATSFPVGSVGKVIVLDAGHGGEDSGAVGVDGTLEKDLNLMMCMQIKDILSSLGYKVVLTRDEDRLLYSDSENIKGKRKHFDLKNRYLIANEYDTAVFVSIHMNKYPVEKYSGTQVYYSKNNSLSRNIAAGIQRNTAAYLQPNNKREIKASNGSIYLLDRLECPAVLIECGFLSNIDECKCINDPAYRKKLAFIVSYSLIENMY